MNMITKWATLIQVVIILLGLFVGAHFSKLSYDEHEKLGHSDLKGHKVMDHGSLDLSGDEKIPRILNLQVLEDPMSGWNIYVEVSNFNFAPEHASQPHRQGQGHAHLYINGNKIGRMYDNWFHIPEFIKDENEIRVTLNSNDHQTFTLGQQAIEKTITISTK